MNKQWLGPRDIETGRPLLTVPQRRAFFGHGIGIIRFLDFTTDEDGEAEVIAEIRRYGSIEAKPFQHWTPGADDSYARHPQEWGAIGDVSSREQDRKQGRASDGERHPDLSGPAWMRKVKAAADFWKHAAGSYPEGKRRLGKCVNCGEAATEKFDGALYCEDCLPDEATD